MKILFEDTVLARGLAFFESPIGLRVRGSREIQKMLRLRADRLKTLDRGNMETWIRFELVRRHDSEEEAIAHVLSHASELEGCRGAVLFTHEGNDETTLKLSDACVKRVESETQGITSRHSYELIGGKLESI